MTLILALLTLRIMHAPIRPVLVALLAGFLLAGCQNLPHGSSAGGRQGPIVIETIDGVPPALRTGLRDGLAKGANQNGITLTDHSEGAAFHLHGYLHAERTSQGFEGFLIFDVFDADQNRLHRLTNSLKRTPSSGLSVESLMTPTEISQLGETAMASLSHYLAQEGHRFSASSQN